METIARINIGDRGIDHVVIVPETPAGQSRVCLILSDKLVSESLDLLNRALMQRAVRERET
jgi:hypothetical protein